MSMKSFAEILLFSRKVEDLQFSLEEGSIIKDDLESQTQAESQELEKLRTQLQVWGAAKSLRIYENTGFRFALKLYGISSTINRRGF